MTSRNETIVRDAFEMTFNQGALEELGRFFSADVRRHSQASPYADHGLPALWGHIQTVRYACPDGRLDLNDAIMAEDLVAFWWTYRGTQDAGSLSFLPVALAVDLAAARWCIWRAARSTRSGSWATTWPAWPRPLRLRLPPGYDAGHGVSWPDDRDFG